MTSKNILPRTKIADFIDNLYDGTCMPSECCHWPTQRWECW